MINIFIIGEHDNIYTRRFYLAFSNLTSPKWTQFDKHNIYIYKYIIYNTVNG